MICRFIKNRKCLQVILSEIELKFAQVKTRVEPQDQYTQYTFRVNMCDNEALSILILKIV